MINFPNIYRADDSTLYLSLIILAFYFKWKFLFDTIFYFLIQCIFLIATEESENKSPNKVTTAQATTNQGAECSYIDRLATNATTAVPGRKLQFHLDSSNDKKDDIKTDEEVIIRNRSLT